jgi:hypothetical protein
MIPSGRLLDIRGWIVRTMPKVFFCRPSPGTVIVASNLLFDGDCELLIDLVPALLSDS